MSAESGAGVYPAPITTIEILYATDFSTPAWRALACARQIALQRHVFLRFVHIVDLSSQEISHHTSFHAALESSHRTLRRIRRELRLAGIREGATVITSGSTAQAIRDAAVRYKSSLILMGLHGEPGLTVPTFGMTTRKILRQPPCPVLTVGLRGPETAAGSFERVLFVTDTDAGSLTAACNAWPASIHGLPRSHFVVLAPALSASVLGAPPAPPIVAPAGAVSLDRPPQLCPHENAAETILAEAARLGANLIVLSIRGGGPIDSIGDGSVARTIITRALCPVLTVRTGAPTTPMRLDRRSLTDTDISAAGLHS
jgi:nucleotide-binding universal stress UspA family protein